MASRRPNPDQLGLLLSQEPVAKRTCCILYDMDETGRGPPTGPVTAVTVILNPHKPIKGLTDSEILTVRKREALYDEIVERTLARHVAETAVEEIDRTNILHVTMLAIQRAVHGVAAPGTLPGLVQVDGNRCLRVVFVVEAVVKGDALVPAISAMSILAKVTYDQQLAVLHVGFPFYGFDAHVGYNTPQYLTATDLHGVTPHHHRSFTSVYRALDGMSAVSIEAIAVVNAWDD